MQKQETEKQFEKHIRQNENLIWKVCRMYAYTGANRQDLFQEIVIQLWKSYPHFKGNASFTTWLYRVAINTAITGLRREKHFITSYEPAALPVTASDESIGEIAAEQWQQLYLAIEQLSQVERAIVLLYMEDTPYAEMEDILGMSQGNLRVKMNRIKERLRELTKQ